MGSDLPKVRLGDYCLKIGSGATPKGGSNVYLDDGEIFLIRSQNIYNDGFTENGLVYITEESAMKLKNVAVEQNDILLNITGDSVARVCLAPEKYLPARVNQHVAIIRSNPEKFDSRYLRYLLVSPSMQAFLLTLASAGATRNALTKGMIEGLEVSKPLLTVQALIADHLEAADDKIQLNRQINQTLEQMAQALFKSWFVDFDPIIDNAQAAGNPIPEALQARAARRAELTKAGNVPQLPDSIRTLFPDRFSHHPDMGWIPAGWEVQQIRDVANVTKGKSYKSSELAESKIALVTLKSFNRGGGYRLDGLKEYTGKYKAEQKVLAGDLIIAYTDVTQAADVIGKPAMVASDPRYEHLVVSLDVAVVRPKVDAHKYFLYGLAQTKHFQDHTRAHSTGTTVLHLSKNAVPEYKFLMPIPEIMYVYQSMVKPNFDAFDKNIASVRSLTKLRDTLLPKLISGELRLPESAPSICIIKNKKTTMTTKAKAGVSDE